MLRYLIFISMMVLSPILAFGEASIPDKDIPGSADTGVVGRFDGSFIISYSKKNFDEATFPLSKLLPYGEKMVDDKGTYPFYAFKPKQSQTLEGKRTRIVYLNPMGASPLEVIRNYENELKNKGGETLFTCKKDECGGDSNQSSVNKIGGEMSLSMYLWPQGNIKDESYSNGYCAQTEGISDQRYSLIEVPESSSFVSIHTYLLHGEHTSCNALNDRTIAIVDILEAQEMQEKMVMVQAEEMDKSITTKGSVSLYGIYFDFNKAVLKPESNETLAQIARLLKEKPELKLLVAGHTDSVGSYESNLNLSTKRATAVVDALVASNGISSARLMPVGLSSASPVATNDTDEGRARNRRVELVKR